jgi:hypothetical protein
MVDQVHVVHARWACCHAGQAGQAAVDMGDSLNVRRTVILQHLLDQVDAAARTVEFIAKRHIGRTGRRAEPAMNALAQNLFRFRDIWISELSEGETGLHEMINRPMLLHPAALMQ